MASGEGLSNDEVLLTIRAAKSLLSGKERIKVKVNVNLTWAELFGHLKIKVNSGAVLHTYDYKEPAPNAESGPGWRAELDEQILEYVNKFKLRRKSYFVQLNTHRLQGRRIRSFNGVPRKGPVRSVVTSTVTDATAQIASATNRRRMKPLRIRGSMPPSSVLGSPTGRQQVVEEGRDNQEDANQDQDDKLNSVDSALPGVRDTEQRSSIANGQNLEPFGNRGAAMTPTPGPSTPRQSVGITGHGDDEAEDEHNNQEQQSSRSAIGIPAKNDDDCEEEVQFLGAMPATHNVRRLPTFNGNPRNLNNQNGRNLEDFVLLDINLGPRNRSSITDGQRIKSRGNRGATPSTQQVLGAPGDLDQPEDHHANQGQQESLRSTPSARNDNSEEIDSDSSDRGEMGNDASVSARPAVDLQNDFRRDGVAVDEGLKASMEGRLQLFDNDLLMKALKEIRHQRRSNGWDRNAFRTPIACFFLLELFQGEAAAETGMEGEWLKPLVIQRMQRFENPWLSEMRNEIRTIRDMRDSRERDNNVNRTPVACYLLQRLLNV